MGLARASLFGTYSSKKYEHRRPKSQQSEVLQLPVDLASTPTAALLGTRSSGSSLGTPSESTAVHLTPTNSSKS